MARCHGDKLHVGLSAAGGGARVGPRGGGVRGGAQGSERLCSRVSGTKHVFELHQTHCAITRRQTHGARLAAQTNSRRQTQGPP